MTPDRKLLLTVAKFLRYGGKPRLNEILDLEIKAVEDQSVVMPPATASAQPAPAAWTDADVRECAVSIFRGYWPPMSDEAAHSQFRKFTPTEQNRLCAQARAVLDFATQRLRADSGKDARIAELESTAALDRKEADTWYSRAQQHKREAVELHSRITELERELADLRSGPTPRPTVEQLVEIGRKAWRDTLASNSIGDRPSLEAIARAVLAADAPAVALPEGLLERLPSDFMVNAMDETRCGAWLDAEYIKAIRELIEWARTLPTAPAISEGVREKAREIAYCVPASELMERFVEDGGHRPFGGVTFRRAIADACSLIRELAAGGTDRP